MRHRDTTAGYDFIVAASWLPIYTDPLRWRDGAGNAARVLRAAVAGRGGAWISTVDGPLEEAALLDNIWLHPIAIDAQTAQDYVHGHCDATLSPLYHDCGPAPQFHPHWADAYRQVNLRLAQAVARSAAPGATVWVHDYQLQLVPGYLRALRPDTRIGFFFHGPFPAVERFLMQPQREEIVASMSAADLVGFQHARAAANYAEVIGALAAPRADGRSATVGVFPASVDVAAIDELTRRPDVRRHAAAIRADLGDPAAVLLSIGSPEHSEASHRMLDVYAQLLAERRIDPERATLVHVAACGDDPTHQRCDRQRLDRVVAQINRVHGRPGRPAIRFVHRESTLPDVVALYMAADVMLALPLRDGMSLAAKEYLVARTDDTGRLVLSEFSGAAADLPEARLVNPCDIDAVKASIVAAVNDCRTPASEVAAMRRRMRRHDAAAWARGFLSTMADVASQEHAADAIDIELNR